MPDFSQLPSVEKLSVALAGESALPRPLVTGFVKRSIDDWRRRRDFPADLNPELAAGSD